MRVAAEVPVHEDVLMWILIIGLSRELPINNADAVELADQLIRRAAALQFEGSLPQFLYTTGFLTFMLASHFSPWDSTRILGLGRNKIHHFQLHVTPQKRYEVMKR